MNKDTNDCQITTGGMVKPTASRAAIEKLGQMLEGNKVIMSDADLDSLTGFKVSNCIRSLPNPQQVGTLDQYLCWIEQRDLDRMPQENDSDLTTIMTQNTKKTLEPGSYSNGTLVSEHLFRRLNPILAEFEPDVARELERDFAGSDDEGKDEIIQTLFYNLNEHCPENHYFGAHPGDGADFGVWECEMD